MGRGVTVRMVGGCSEDGVRGVLWEKAAKVVFGERVCVRELGDSVGARELNLE